MALPSYFEIIPAFQQFVDSSGNPLSGGTVETYAAGTSTPKVTYRESDGVTSNGSTITLDSNGNTPYGVWGTAGAYKIILKNSLGSTIRTRDNVRGVNDITRNGWRLIESKTAANSATIDFLTGFTDYTHYMLRLSTVIPSSDAVSLWLRSSTDGATFLTGGSDYKDARSAATDAGTETYGGTTGAAQITLATILGNAAQEHISGTLEFTSPASSVHKSVRFFGSSYTSTPNLVFFLTAGMVISSSPMLGLRFLMSSGNISSGRFDLYGLED